MGEWYFTLGAVFGVVLATIGGMVLDAIRRRMADRARWDAWHRREEERYEYEEHDPWQYGGRR